LGIGEVKGGGSARGANPKSILRMRKELAGGRLSPYQKNNLSVKWRKKSYPMSVSLPNQEK